MKKKLFLKFFVFAVIAAFVTVTSCKDYDDDISNLNKQITDLKTELQGKIDAVAPAVKAELEAKIKTVSDDLAAAVKKLDDLEKSAASKAELDAAKADILAKVVALDAYTAFKNKTEGDLADLKTNAQALETAVGLLEANSATKAELDLVKKALEDRAKALEDRAEALEENSATKTELNDVKEALEKRAEDLEDRAKALEENSATKAELEEVKEQLEGELEALRLEVTTKFSEIDKTLEDMDIRVTALEENLEALTEKLDKEVEALINKISDLKAELNPRIITIETLLAIGEDGKSATLDKIDADLADQLKKIGENKAAIEKVAEDLGKKYAELVLVDEGLQNQIDDNTGDIATINKYIDETLKPQLSTIEGDIKKINDETIPQLEARLDLKILNLLTVVTNRLSSIALAPNAYVGGIEAIEFTTLVYKPMEAGEDKLVPDAGFTMSTAKPAIASYKFGPRSFNLANADYKYVDRQATVRSTTVRSTTASSLVVIEGAPVKNAADGTVNFTLRRQNAHDNAVDANNNKKNFIQLEATLKGDAVDADESEVVISAEQELVYDNIITPSNIFISDKATLATGGNAAHYALTFADATKEDPRYEAAYDKVFDLLKRVATCDVSGSEHENFDIDAYNLSYRFSVASTEYNLPEGSTVTNQQDWVELISAEEGTYNAKEFNVELVGRTPILKVELVDTEGNVVRRGFVKIKFVADKTPDITVGETHSLVYKCEENVAEFEISEQYIRDNVYRIITSGKQTGMSHEMFWKTYEFDNASVLKNNVAHTMTVPEIVSGATGVGTATKKIVWKFTHGELGQIGVGGSRFVATVTVKNKLVSSEFPEYVTFQFTVNVKLPNVNLPAANKVENDTYWSKDADGNYVAYQVNINVPESTTSPESEAQFRTSLPQAYTKYNVDYDGACGESYYKIVDTYSNGVRDVTSSGASAPLAGVGIDGNDITLEKTGDNAVAVKAALNSTLGLQASVAHVYVLQNGEEIVVNTFLVNFIRPVNLNMPDGVTVKDAQDDGDIADFQWNGILTDWRGRSIVAPEGWTRVEKSHSYWRYVYTPEYEWVDGRYEQTRPAELDIEYGDVEFIVGAPGTLYKGEATYLFQTRPGFGSWTTNRTEVFTSGTYLTKDEVDRDLEAQRVAAETAYQVPLLEDRVEQSGATRYTDVPTQVGQTVKYKYVKNVVYVPAQYEWIDGKYVMKPHTPTPRPTYDGTANGQTSGDWEWRTRTWNKWEWVPGQYWFYYGPFGAITADLSKVTTNLEYNEYQLPSQVTLTQVGNTVKYVNVGAPIAYSYEIYIPVSVNYGWGTVSTQLTIKVDPVN